MQLVLSSELHDAIRQRAEDTKPVTSKKNKAVKSKQKHTLQLTAADITIPEGIFREGADIPLKQIEATQVGPDAQGVIVLDPFEAVPYLKRHRKVSSKGLAMLVIGAQGDLLHGIGQPVRFPATCTRTDEPVLLTAHIVQLGSLEVTRNTTEQAPKVEVVTTQVLKIVAYKDEMHSTWGALCERPVRFVLEHIPELKEDPQGSKIIDVWDRQWLSGRLERVRQDHAEVFAFSVRLTGVDTRAIMQRSGAAGFYFEPKAIDGRGHSDEFRIIWLNRVDKQEALVQCQSLKQWSCIVRSNRRFGVRVLTGDAEAVHGVVKPSTPFLGGADLLEFIGGPFPYGATRQSLTKLFQSWGWNAKPCQPKSRSSDGRGILWFIQSAGKPPYEVYQMDRSDVLLSQCTKRAKEIPGPIVDVQASARTIDALKAHPGNKQNDTDPLQIHDPWAPPGLKRPATSQVNVKEIAAQVEQRVSAALQATERDPPDVAMEDEGRVKELESRLTQLELSVQSQQAEVSQHLQHVNAQIGNHAGSIQMLEQTVQTHRAEQVQRSAAVTQQIQQVRVQVEAQATSLQTHLDQEQLESIERLLGKKARAE